MSSYLAPNFRQPVDFVKQDHMTLVEMLRRKEIKLVYERNASAEHIAYIDKHGSDFYSTEMVCYTTNEDHLIARDDELLELYGILSSYYKYEDGYTKMLRDHTLKILPYELSEFTCHDGYWCSDPTMADDWSEEKHKKRRQENPKTGMPLCAVTKMG
jgi:hypothetical protein